MTSAATASALALEDYALEDRYRKQSGQVYLSGSQALVRLPLMQRERDLASGLNTAGFISGYTGSPLGGYDTTLKAAQRELDEHHIVFQPGINEELGATAVWGSQQTDLMGGALYDGVFALWYGKGPGVDRAGDALKHGNYSGSSRHGGVLVLTGDDHGAKSSTIAHQSDHALIHFGMPYFNPATVQDYLDYGLYGFALSRYSGCWIGMKCVTDTIESSASVNVSPDQAPIVIPETESGKEGDLALHARWGIHPVQAEQRHYQQRIPRVKAFIKANRLNRPVIHQDHGALGIVTTGKAHLDLMQALEELGLDEDACKLHGIGVFKVAMPWPLEPDLIAEFVRCYDRILVVEEKRPIIEQQLASLFVNDPTSPILTGKMDESGAPLISSEAELNATVLSQVIATTLSRQGVNIAPPCHGKPNTASGGSLVRMPSFCAGCPHNTSTKVPEGSVAFGGIGCHGMATFLPERNTPTLFQMGGEGAAWIGLSPFTEKQHMFQNLGDGTYFHSGLLAIRAAVAGKVNITYKILVNDAIAMTGGQTIEGNVRVDDLTRQVASEGVRRIALVSDNIEKYRSGYDFAPGVTLHHRDDLNAVQRELREIEGVSAIIYEQYCATELRRRRKRGMADDPDRRVFINPRVCEGCGDCGVQSNCIAIEPVETPFGRKRRINQSACNKDFSCTKGYCPSFVTVHGGTPRNRSRGKGATLPAEAARLAADLPPPQQAPLNAPFSLLVTGIGGAGVVTVGALLGMAAHLEGKGCSVLDVAGLAQRNGPVTSHVRIANRPEELHATRIVTADLLLGCDIVVSSGQEAVSKLDSQRSRVVVNTRVAPTSAFASNPDLNLTPDGMIASMQDIVGHERGAFVDAGRLAYALLGNEIAANLFLLGYAIQKGWMPISLDAVLKAVELNGVSVDMNKAALTWGRIAANDPHTVERFAFADQAKQPARSETANELADRLTSELTAYQNASYAQKYRELVDSAEKADLRFPKREQALTGAVARYYYKLMAYKDEYEVARLYADDSFRRALEEEFEGDLTLEFHMAPPKLQKRDPETGRYRKRTFGPRTMLLYKVLAKLKVLRGTPFDIFGHNAHRKLERQLIDDYAALMRDVLLRTDADNYDLAVQIASWPELIRGYDTVKDEHLARAREHLASLLESFFSPAPQPMALEAAE
ncbi:indolepyruvate ferredoxin oxidoreductase [Croceicoccus estronivorus]|uniref:indolepyruvate ferredoxin oxidoreductase family protein n=1 Tax=Croceicoccus estronivorus TaxID=1172626 RepID=UPI00082CF50D|nr:indolepyruvate ferredoxin oxidoreductase family protein [Croceicoccus estronivorus]OCC25610.1 indolepyruvate ferredoxin oxidoreductase [Croceicoccus estronivorus]